MAELYGRRSRAMAALPVADRLFPPGLKNQVVYILGNWTPCLLFLHLHSPLIKELSALLFFSNHAGGKGEKTAIHISLCSRKQFDTGGFQNRSDQFRHISYNLTDIQDEDYTKIPGNFTCTRGKNRLYLTKKLAPGGGALVKNATVSGIGGLTVALFQP